MTSTLLERGGPNNPGTIGTALGDDQCRSCYLPPEDINSEFRCIKQDGHFDPHRMIDGTEWYD